MLSLSYTAFVTCFNFIGMWGVKVYQRRDLVEGITRAMIGYGQTNKFFSRDQEALEMFFWPTAKYDVVYITSSMFHSYSESVVDDDSINKCFLCFCIWPSDVRWLTILIR